jgi:hypothetical protein
MLTLTKMCPTTLMHITSGEAVLELAAAHMLEDGSCGSQLGLAG